MAEEIHEGFQEEYFGFNVVENITSYVYQQRHQDCVQKKLELIESFYNVTCKSGGIELVWVVVPDSIPESPPIEFQDIGIWEMDWDKFNKLSSYAKASEKKNKSNDEKPMQRHCTAHTTFCKSLCTSHYIPMEMLLSAIHQCHVKSLSAPSLACL
jgi:hypothetical protein